MANLTDLTGRVTIGARIWSFLRSVPTLLFIFFLGVTLFSVQTGERKYLHVERLLSQWDGQHYLSIARDGYEVFPCHDRPDELCGNAGWFPGYPLVGAIIGASGVDMRWVMLGISWISFLFALHLLYGLVHRRFSRRVAIVTVVALAAFPTSFYFLTTFPYALYLLFALLILRALELQTCAQIPLCAGLLAITYPSGLLIGIPILYTLVQSYQSHTRSQRVWLISGLLAIPAALLAYSIYNLVAFGDFWLYSRIQSQAIFGHHLSFPLLPILKTLTSFPIGHPETIGLLVALVSIILLWTRRLPTPWLLYGLAILLFTPTFGTTQCYYRHIVVAFPLAIMAGLLFESRRRLLLLLVVPGWIILHHLVYLPGFKQGWLM